MLGGSAFSWLVSVLLCRGLVQDAIVVDVAFDHMASFLYIVLTNTGDCEQNDAIAGLPEVLLL